jgi:hypothetical protein
VGVAVGVGVGVPPGLKISALARMTASSFPPAISSSAQNGLGPDEREALGTITKGPSDNSVNAKKNGRPARPTTLALRISKDTFEFYGTTEDITSRKRHVAVRESKPMIAGARNEISPRRHDQQQKGERENSNENNKDHINDDVRSSALLCVTRLCGSS